MAPPTMIVNPYLKKAPIGNGGNGGTITGAAASSSAAAAPRLPAAARRQPAGPTSAATSTATSSGAAGPHAKGGAGGASSGIGQRRAAAKPVGGKPAAAPAATNAGRATGTGASATAVARHSHSRPGSLPMRAGAAAGGGGGGGGAVSSAGQRRQVGTTAAAAAARSKAVGPSSARANHRPTATAPNRTAGTSGSAKPPSIHNKKPTSAPRLHSQPRGMGTAGTASANAHIASTTSTASSRPPTTLRAQLKQQIADLKRAKLLRQRERQAADRARQLEAKRRRDREETAKAEAEAEEGRQREKERREQEVKVGAGTTSTVVVPSSLGTPRGAEIKKKEDETEGRGRGNEIMQVEQVQKEEGAEESTTEEAEEEVKPNVDTKQPPQIADGRIARVEGSNRSSACPPSASASASPPATTVHPHPAAAQQPPSFQYPQPFTGGGSPEAHQYQYQHQHHGPHGGPMPTGTMGPPPPPSSHPRGHPQSHPPVPPVMMTTTMPMPMPMPMPPSRSQQQHHPGNVSVQQQQQRHHHHPHYQVTPSPYGVAAGSHSPTPNATPSNPKKQNDQLHHQQHHQQLHRHHHQQQQYSYAESTTSPNKVLSFCSPTKSAGGRGGTPSASPTKKWESPVDHGAIIENIFKEMGEFEIHRGTTGNDDGSPGSHGSFHMDISPIKIEGLADSPPREEAGATSAGLDLPPLSGKARAAGAGASEGNDVDKERRQEQAPPPPPTTTTTTTTHPAGPWMSPHPGAAAGATAATGVPPPLPPSSAYFAAYPQQFPFGFPPHAYPYPLPNAMPSAAQVPAHVAPATPSSSNSKQQQQNVMPMASPFGAWPTATATPGRVASAVKPATPSNSVSISAGTPVTKSSGTNPSNTGKSKGTGTIGSSPRPSPSKKGGTTILHERIMEPPSPFAASYEVVKNPIIITKSVGGSFGIDMRQETRSVLVDSQAKGKPTNSSAAIIGGEKDQNSGSPKKRRRRVYFCAMLAVKAEKQNARKDAAKKGSDILRPGDIVLSVDDRATGGLSFKQAAALFAAAKTPAKGDESKSIQCFLTVARPKIIAPGLKPSFVAVPQQKVPLVLGNGMVVTGDFNEIEVRALLDGFKSIRKYGDMLLQTQTKYGASLGFLKGLLTHPTIGRDLARRDMNAIITKLSFTKAKIVLSMNAAATKHFTEQWQKECERASKDSIAGHADGELKLLSDAKRSTLRLLPRPGKGCKCGAEDHRFAHDERCLLYRDVIPHIKPQDLEPFKTSSKKMRSRKAEAEIESAIASALQERQIQAKRDQEDERQEAMFVDLMERTQVTKLKKATFAPGLLSVAIVSAVATLMEQRSSTQVVESNESDDDSDDDDDDDDDDDIPLNALSSSAKPPAKKQKVEATPTNIHPSFASVAAILLHISKTWGHLLKDYESNAEYAWHLKLGGLDSGESLDQYRRNPRPAQSLSFENIQFLLNDDMVSRLKSPSPAATNTPAVGAPTTGTSSTSPNSSTPNATAGTSSESNTKSQTTTEAPTLANQQAMDELTIAILASQECTGIWDEIQALVTSEVLQIDRDGTVVLRQDWQGNVGASILLDGHEKGWFKEHDPGNSFCLHEDMRTLVPDIWTRRDNGWAFADNKPEEGVEFNENEYLDIKREYIRDYGSHFDQIDGVGRFGGATE